jgi:hypothetical protein
MKKICIFVFLALLAPRAYPAEFKIMAGLSLSKSTEPLFSYQVINPPQSEYGAGLLAGGGIEFSLTRNITFEADALYIQKGSKIRLEDQGMVIGHLMERMSEISFPLLIKISLKPGTSPYIVGGGEIAFVLPKGPKRIDYGLVVGVGFRKQLKKFDMSLEGRYYHGLQDLHSILRKMRVFVFTVGFSI